MRFHWLCDCETQGQLRFFWKPGKTNLADYFTKHHPPAHHVNIRSEFLKKVKDLAEAKNVRDWSKDRLQNHTKYKLRLATRVC